MTVTVPDDVKNADNISSQKIYVWEDSMQPVCDAIDVKTLDKSEIGEPVVDPDYLINENFNNTRGNWGFTGKNRTYITNQLLKFAGGGADEMDIKTMDKSVADSKNLSIEFDWRSDTDLSSNGRSAVMELADKNDRVFFALYTNTRSGIMYSTKKSAYGDDDLSYDQFDTNQSKNSDWYHTALTVDFANGEIVSGTVTRGGKDVLKLSNVPIEAVNFEYMKMIDTYSVSGMSIDNVKIKNADIFSDDTSLESAVIKGRAAEKGEGAAEISEITNNGNIRINGTAAQNPYKRTEFAAHYGGADVKAVKYAAGITDYSDFDTAIEYSDENIENGDVFIIRVTAANGDTAYYKIAVEVTDGSEDAFLTDFSISDGDTEYIDGFVYDASSEEKNYDYGSRDVAATTETLTLSYTPSDDRLLTDDKQSGGISVSVEGGSYEVETIASGTEKGKISLSDGENKITVTVTSRDGSEVHTYTFTVNKTEYLMLESFDSGKVPAWIGLFGTEASITDSKTLLLVQDGGSGPRSSNGWAFNDKPITGGVAEFDFDLKMKSADNTKGGDTGFYLVGSKSSYKNNAYFDYTGGIVGIRIPAKSTAANCMLIESGSGTTAEPIQTTMNNPSGDKYQYPWAHINVVIDFDAKTAAVKITDKDNPNGVWFEGTQDFIDASVTDLRGFQITLGRAKAAFEIDNLKVKQN